MSSKRAAIDVEESDSVAKRSHALDHLGVLVTKIGATRKYDETKDHSSEKYDGSQVDGEKDNGFDAEGLARDKRLESATGKRHENAKGDNSHHIPDTLLKKLTMGTWLGKSMLIDCSSSKV
ncbi:hypothetical protein SARC_13317 [Sphaeroforma arctica JP610]|uniref:Uncharacterized protein n=1 Tax=Sphaeroforma arctica JP610 TaxID=667725 RepID=A0A0L0FCF0_9EUKA|nr:hypothetical protein SARC_13317 [Sphaeroforma arctica JP610]KNC74126.1 hypothetical protein SARC_13317 [Sphaeroforma arctica JP610]|eukprot:XP_014148028.1 hypothetical protein SARC_13317 [Sphaeroforma arctica JP610]